MKTQHCACSSFMPIVLTSLIRTFPITEIVEKQRTDCFQLVNWADRLKQEFIYTIYLFIVKEQFLSSCSCQRN